MSANPINPVHPVLTPSASPERAARIDALDWTKGALVIFMVIYHAINYSAYRPLAFQYLSFVPPSFILIAGFLVGQIYASKYDLKSWTPYLRLALRGLKLLLLFTALNILNCVMMERSLYYGFWLFFDRAYPIFISGNGRVGIFEVLLPIAYFLLLAPVLLWLRGKIAFAIPILAFVLFLFCIVLERRGAESENLSFLSCGLIGMALGLVSMDRINWFATQWIPVLLTYLAYRLVSRYFGETYAVQILAAGVSLSLIYCVASHLSTSHGSWRAIVLLGNYSLFSYLAQILLLRVFVILFGGLPESMGMVLAVIVSASFALYLWVLAVDWGRRKNRFLNFAYKTVFA